MQHPEALTPTQVEEDYGFDCGGQPHWFVHLNLPQELFYLSGLNSGSRLAQAHATENHGSAGEGEMDVDGATGEQSRPQSPEQVVGRPAPSTEVPSVASVFPTHKPSDQSPQTRVEKTQDQLQAHAQAVTAALQDESNGTTESESDPDWAEKMLAKGAGQSAKPSLAPPAGGDTTESKSKSELDNGRATRPVQVPCISGQHQNAPKITAGADSDFSNDDDQPRNEPQDESTDDGRYARKRTAKGHIREEPKDESTDDDRYPRGARRPKAKGRRTSRSSMAAFTRPLAEYFKDKTLALTSPTKFYGASDNRKSPKRTGNRSGRARDEENRHVKSRAQMVRLPPEYFEDKTAVLDSPTKFYRGSNAVKSSKHTSKGKEAAKPSPQEVSPAKKNKSVRFADGNSGGRDDASSPKQQSPKRKRGEGTSADAHQRSSKDRLR